MEIIIGIIGGGIISYIITRIYYEKSSRDNIRELKSSNDNLEKVIIKTFNDFVITLKANSVPEKVLIKYINTTKKYISDTMSAEHHEFVKNLANADELVHVDVFAEQTVTPMYLNKKESQSNIKPIFIPKMDE